MINKITQQKIDFDTKNRKDLHWNSLDSVSGKEFMHYEFGHTFGLVAYSRSYNLNGEICKHIAVQPLRESENRWLIEGADNYFGIEWLDDRIDVYNRMKDFIAKF